MSVTSDVDVMRGVTKHAGLWTTHFARVVTAVFFNRVYTPSQSHATVSFHRRWLGSRQGVGRATQWSVNSPHYWDGCDRLRTGIPSPYATSHSGQLSFLPSVGREMSTGQSAVWDRNQDG